MGNCFAQPTVEEPAKPSALSPSPSVASTAWLSAHVCQDFVVKDEKISSTGLKVMFGDESFVVLHPETGLVLVSVSRVAKRELAVSTPDGRTIGTIQRLRPDSLEFRHFQGWRLRAATTENRTIVVTDTKSEICQIDLSSDRFVGTVPRGTDLVILCVLTSAFAFN